MKSSALRLALVFLCGTLFVSMGVGLQAEDKTVKLLGDPLRGEGIAQRLCVNCHVTSPDSKKTVPAGVPPFTEIANRPEQTANRIRGVLIEPHSPMPDLHLTRIEIEDIIAYLDQLRDKQAGPPLIPDKEPIAPKMIYPDAS